jgi:ATP-binding cassette subfamily F protein uup
MKVIDAVTSIAEVIVFDEKTKYTASQFLQLFLFYPADQQKLISKLSGGEKRRLYLATILMKKPNFLILDEPTNDLDIITLEILEEYLSKFKGCVIIISHDRFFMDKTVDHIFVFEGNGVIKDFPGNYSDYREWKTITEKENLKKTSNQVSNSIDTRKQRDNSNKLTFKEKKEFEALEKDLELLNKEKAEIETKFQSGASADELIKLSSRYEQIKEELDEKELRWLELSEKES